MRLICAFFFAAMVSALALPPSAVGSVKHLENRLELSFGEKFLNSIDMTQVSENVKNVLAAGRKFEKFRRTSKIDVVSYYCPGNLKQKVHVTNSQEMELEKFRNVLGGAGLDVKDLFCHRASKRDISGGASRQQPFYFFGVTRDYWDYLRQLLKKAVMRND